MISGIAKLYIQLHSNIYSKGFSFGGNRLGFSLKQNINWVEVPIQRDSASDSGSVSNQANSFTVEAKTIGLNLGLLNYNGKRVVCRYITNNNQERIIGVDQATTVSISYSSGEKLGDEQGMILKFAAQSKMIPELLMPFTPVYPENPEPENPVYENLVAPAISLVSVTKTNNTYIRFVFDVLASKGSGNYQYKNKISFNGTNWSLIDSLVDPIQWNTIGTLLVSSQLGDLYVKTQVYDIITQETVLSNILNCSSIYP